MLKVVADRGPDKVGVDIFKAKEWTLCKVVRVGLTALQQKFAEIGDTMVYDGSVALNLSKRYRLSYHGEYFVLELPPGEIVTLTNE